MQNLVCNDSVLVGYRFCLRFVRMGYASFLTDSSCAEIAFFPYKKHLETQTFASASFKQPAIQTYDSDLHVASLFNSPKILAKNIDLFVKRV